MFSAGFAWCSDYLTVRCNRQILELGGSRGTMIRRSRLPISEGESHRMKMQPDWVPHSMNLKGVEVCSFLFVP